jgi:hypothetical protein
MADRSLYDRLDALEVRLAALTAEAISLARDLEQRRTPIAPTAHWPRRGDLRYGTREECDRGRR